MAQLLPALLSAHTLLSGGWEVFLCIANPFLFECCSAAWKENNRSGERAKGSRTAPVPSPAQGRSWNRPRESLALEIKLQLPQQTACLPAASIHPVFPCSSLAQLAPAELSLQTWEARGEERRGGAGRGKKACRPAEAGWQQNKSCEKWWERSARGAGLQPLCSVGPSAPGRALAAGRRAGSGQQCPPHRACCAAPPPDQLEDPGWEKTGLGVEFGPYFGIRRWGFRLGCRGGRALSPQQRGCPSPRGGISCRGLFRLPTIPT